MNVLILILITVHWLKTKTVSILLAPICVYVKQVTLCIVVVDVKVFKIQCHIAANNYNLWSIDIDECMDADANDCSGANEKCLNINGSFYCDCMDGYRKNNRTQQCEGKVCL